MFISPVVNFGTAKLWFKGGFFSPLKRTDVATLYEHCEGLPNGLFRCLTTKRHNCRPRRLPGKAYLFDLKVGVTSANE